ncbi:MAG: hypothetical protein D6798_01130 [Deltaproteobacteria bacterium]|nr:MAG: hypothetical protein D6798_01130 [Deltaproteobacteria bacterium]
MFALLAALFVLPAHADCHVEVQVESGPEYDRFKDYAPVRLTKTGADPCSVDLVADELPWATAPASDGSDFIATRQTVHFAAGDDDHAVLVDTFDDHDVEPDEAFGVWLENLSGVTSVKNLFTMVTIENDDGGFGVEPSPVLVDASGAADVWGYTDDAGNEEVFEWRAYRLVHIYLDAPRSEETWVSYRTISPTDPSPYFSATPGVDYGPVSGVAHFAPGQLDYFVEIPFYDDSTYEWVEELELVLEESSGAPISGRSRLITRIFDYEDCPVEDSMWDCM